MSEKLGLTKPPVPLRPKNLVVLNSKHLPKPPETFSSENVTNFIKDLNLDVKDDEKDRPVEKKCESSITLDKGIISNEEESYKYLDPTLMDLPVVYTNKLYNEKIKKKNVNRKQFNCDILEKAVNHDNSVFFVPTVNESKLQIPQNLWHRPLPLLPEETKLSVTNMPWYKNVDRKKGEQILKNGVDGFFLVRPSSNLDTYLTLTLWYNKRVYNIPIRKRKDGKFALGTPKVNEQSFDSVEFLIKNYQSEKLVLYSNGEQTGKTLLTTFPS